MQHKDLGRKADITGLREEETHSWNVRRRGEGGSTWNLLSFLLGVLKNPPPQPSQATLCTQERL